MVTTTYMRSNSEKNIKKLLGMEIYSDIHKLFLNVMIFGCFEKI